MLLLFIDPTIGNFNVMPKSFLGLETSCPASDPYDNFTLICTASKPAIVIPNLTVVWYNNGSVRNGMVSSENSGTFITNTLTFPTSSVTDSGTYRCQARLDIPDSPSITLMEESIVTVRREYLIHWYLCQLFSYSSEGSILIYWCNSYCRRDYC